MWAEVNALVMERDAPFAIHGRRSSGKIHSDARDLCKHLEEHLRGEVFV